MNVPKAFVDVMMITELVGLCRPCTSFRSALSPDCLSDPGREIIGFWIVAGWYLSGLWVGFRFGEGPGGKKLDWVGIEIAELGTSSIQGYGSSC